jgi:hypothetical protein
MGRYSAPRFRLWSGQPVNAPMVTPPLSLRAVLVLCIVSVTGTLLYGVATELSTGAGSDKSLAALLAIVACYFLLPMLIAHTIATNRAQSRVLILAYVAAVIYALAGVLEAARLDSAGRGVAVAGLVAAPLLIAWWLYRSPRLRLYYALVAGKEVPDDLRSSTATLLVPGRLEAMFGQAARRLAPWFETAAVLLVLLGIIVAISWTGGY